MSPRRVIVYDEECPHAVCEEYVSRSRGMVTRTIICRHPENEGCVCMRSFEPDAECPWLEEALEECKEQEAEKA